MCSMAFEFYALFRFQRHDPDSYEPNCSPKLPVMFFVPAEYFERFRVNMTDRHTDREILKTNRHDPHKLLRLADGRNNAAG